MWESKSTKVKLSWAIESVCRRVRHSPALSVSIAPVSLVALLSLGGANWLAQMAIAPLVAQAYTARVDLSLNRQTDESYQTLLHRAEAFARAATQRSFDKDILVTDVSVMVLVQNQGIVAPILSLQVTRQGWKSHPDPQSWTTYYPTAQSLLRLQDVVQPAAGRRTYPYQPPATVNPEPAPQPTITPSPTPTTPNRFRNRYRGNVNPGTQPPGTNPGTQPQVTPLPTSPTQ